MTATLQRNCAGGIIFVAIAKIITKETVPRNYFVTISARMVKRVEQRGGQAALNQMQVTIRLKSAKVQSKSG